MTDAKQLPVPAAARKDSRAFELLRVWVADGEQPISLRAGIWEDPAAWGMMLADLAGHIANSLEQGAGLDREEAMEQMKEALLADWDAAPEELSGELSGEA